MGHDLYRMLLAGAPADWTTGERLIALVIADHCSDRTNAGYLSNTELCRETGLAPQTVRRLLASLAVRGYEFRVPIARGQDGRLVYSNRGRATDYRVPIIPPRPQGAQFRAPSEAKGAQFRAPCGKERRSVLTRKALSSDLKALSSERPIPLTPQATPISEVLAVNSYVEGEPGWPDGGAARQPIEEQAWAAIQRGQLCGQQTSTPTTSGGSTFGSSNASAQPSSTARSAPMRSDA